MENKNYDIELTIGNSKFIIPNIDKNLNEFERNATNLVHNSLLNNNIRNHVNTYNKNCIKKYTALKLLPIQNKDKLSILS